MNKRQQICKKLVKNAQAVSPIIATLMLVLVTVGAAGAFYLWQTGWQKTVTQQVGTPTPTETLSVGGSTTCFEFTQYAKSAFEAKYPTVKINLQGGGSDSGIIAAGTGLTDIGCSSKVVSDAYLALYPDLNGDGKKDIGSSLVSTPFAYDGVCIIHMTGSTHFGASGSNLIWAMNQDTIQKIYKGTYQYWAQVPCSPGNATLCSVNGTINRYGRADGSGTESSFVKLFLSAGDNNMPYGGYSATNDYTGNPAMLAALAADNNGIGFGPYGMLSTYTLTQVPYTKTTGTPITANYANIANSTWAGSRSLWFVTVGEPSGLAKEFIDFCRDTQMNQDLCSLSNYVSLYANTH